MNAKQVYKQFFILLLTWVTYGLIIGGIVGSTTAFLLQTNDYLGEIREKNIGLILLLPIGGIIIGFIYKHFGKVGNNDVATGNNLLIDSIHGNANMLKRTGPIVFFSTFLTVFLGGSTGREGAAIQMGGSVAESVNQFLKVKPLDKKILLMCGISAAFGAAFGAPIAGTIFGMEMVAQGKMKYEAFVPCIVASFISYYVDKVIWATHHQQFIIKETPDTKLNVFLIIILVSIIFSILAVIYCQLRHGIQKVSEKYLKKNHILRAFIGGCIIIALTFIVGNQEYNGRGLNMLKQSFNETVPPYAFLFKLVFTAITLGSGFVGGEAIPLFFMGATLGNTLSGVVGLPISFLAAIGLITVFCAGANTPIAAFLLSIEMFDGKGIQFFFVACLVSYFFSGHHGLWPAQTIYDPKSRLFHVKSGNSIKTIEKDK